MHSITQATRFQENFALRAKLLSISLSLSRFFFLYRQDYFPLFRWLKDGQPITDGNPFLGFLLLPYTWKGLINKEL